MLQKADKVAHNLLDKEYHCEPFGLLCNAFVTQAGKMAEVWQFPVVLAPLSVNGDGEAVILRPVCSREVRPMCMVQYSVK